MQRLMHQETAYNVGLALSWFPAPLRDMLERVDIFEGDAFWAGLVDAAAEMVEGAATAGTQPPRSLRETSHFLADHWQQEQPRSRRRDTVVLCQVERPSIIVHELAHALDCELGRREGLYYLSQRVLMPACTEYAATTPQEAWAEAWCAYLGIYPMNATPILADERARALLDGLW